jgi:hypothetical protein
MIPRRWIVPAALLCGVTGAAARAAAQRVTAENVIVVTLDGLRWQEVFDGAAHALINRAQGGVADSAALVQRFWRESAEERRAALLPFLWTTIAVRGQVFGDSTRGSPARVTNGLRFSYPGYNELLAGAPDQRIASNDTVLNPNVTVLEWLHGLPRFRGRVAAFGSWEVLPYIVNARRSGVFTNGDGPPVADPRTERDRLLNDFAADLPPYWGSVRFDAATMHGALEYVRTHRPRVLYVMLGDTDEWAHERRYDLYLDAAWRADRFVRRLWETAQTLEQYAGRTALLVTTDHGRGAAPADWTDHGRDVPAAERIWIAVLGPDTPALAVRERAPVTQAQVAATVAALVGEDFRRAAPLAAPPLPEVVALPDLPRR